MQQGRTLGKFFSFFIIALTLAVTSKVVLAATDTVLPAGFGQYQNIQIEQGDVKDGQVVSIEDGKYTLAQEAYSSKMQGVVVFKPAVAISNIGQGEKIYPIVTTGTVNVLVSAENGAIEPGDFLTSSTQPGIAIKATQSGFVLGVAQAEASPGNGESVLIPVSIDIKFTTSSEQSPLSARAFSSQIVNALTIGLRAVSSEPNTALRYAAAALVVIASITFGFLLFGRSATNGIMAIGRNPLARKSIFVMLILNIAMTLGFAIIGLVMALFILAA